MSWTLNRTIAQIAFTVAVTACGVNVMGNARCILLRSRQFVHFSMGITTFIGCTISFLTPLFVGLMCPNNAAEEWSRLFSIASVIVVVAYIPFPIFSSDQPGSYVFPNEN
ncbi:unnamed protein product [Caenorhabditis sp. 36 PRJEB53466]|nr:unnamed protein product [Caenorhabditis sp. 36 PRJEB53466]